MGCTTLKIVKGIGSDINPGIRQAYFITYYLAPAGIAILVVGLFLLVLMSRDKSDNSMGSSRSLLPALCWAVAAVVIHNLIDFAIFETAVWMAVVICLAAILSVQSAPTPAKPRSPRFRGLVLFALMASMVCFFLIAVIPPVRAGRNIQLSLRNPKQAAELLRVLTHHTRTRLTGQAHANRRTYPGQNNS